MRRILVNTAIDFTRKQKQKTEMRMEDVHENVGEEEENNFVVDEKRLIEAIRSLPEMHAKIFNMYALDNFSHKEIADALGIKEDLSRYYLSTARKQLKEKLAPFINE